MYAWWFSFLFCDVATIFIVFIYNFRSLLCLLHEFESYWCWAGTNWHGVDAVGVEHFGLQVVPHERSDGEPIAWWFAKLDDACETEASEEGRRFATASTNLWKRWLWCDCWCARLLVLAGTSSIASERQICAQRSWWWEVGRIGDEHYLHVTRNRRRQRWKTVHVVSSILQYILLSSICDDKRSVLAGFLGRWWFVSFLRYRFYWILNVVKGYEILKFEHEP